MAGNRDALGFIKQSRRRGPIVEIPCEHPSILIAQQTVAASLKSC
jgi:hypothetical protein